DGLPWPILARGFAVSGLATATMVIVLLRFWQQAQHWPLIPAVLAAMVVGATAYALALLAFARRERSVVLHALAAWRRARGV
ncbi:MAG: hypothetical protein GXO36_06955, partial [Chloroflexi bacterium]|nr:hypothetical protein [Chloroflexota bacterium]